MKPVSTEVSFPKIEEGVLQFWREKNIFARSMSPEASRVPHEDSGPKRKSFVFYDGPPFATGLPHYGHLLAGTIKDVVGRFFTMKGYHVDRRFGWDCHGLPVEFEIQKKLNLHGAKAIRAFGIANFNEECRKIVLRYTKEWEKFVERSGRWVDFERQYRTMDLPFMESIWWVFKRLWDRGLIYEGFKCVPYSWAINTPLSNFEVNSNYKTVSDPAITIRVGLDIGADAFLNTPSDFIKYPLNAYIWTTTPWTIPSNMALAVNSHIDYVIVANPDKQENVLLAKNCLGEIFPQLGEVKTNGHSAPRVNGSANAEHEAESAVLLGEVKGEKLVGVSYRPIFSYFSKEKQNNAFKIYHGDFVTAEEGTGIVHLASFGEDDLQVFIEHEIPIIDPVDEDGNFTGEVTDFAGQNVKAADPKIINYLRNSGQLVSQKTIQHSYPFCWRTDTPLIFKSISTWFVNVEEIRDELTQMNSIIYWVPDHIRDGRMGKWLEGARDWAVSRNRYWGTPIPVWKCDGCSEKRCLGSIRELEQLTKTTISDLHSHFIDKLTFPCDKCSGLMKRIPEVLDCWFESGSMPYAQKHYPFESKEEFEANFPADFIAEGLDQTRGWFYTLLVLSTALFGRPAFRNVIVNGIVLAEDGKKMSKSLQNYPPPEKVMDEFGADAMRLYLLSSAATRAEELRFSEAGVREVVRQTLLPLWNAYNFLVSYALVDKWTPAQRPSGKSKNLLDRWIVSKVVSLVKNVDSVLSAYHLYAAAGPILDFVDQLTNWYIRLNRRRFWAANSAEDREDKLHAYTTLHQALLTFVRVLSPLAPFLSDEIFLNLKDGVKELDFDSVHLAPFPQVEELQGWEIDEKLERAMELFEEIIVLARTLRNDHNVKVRQPLPKLTIVHPKKEILENIQVLEQYICDELNVKNVEYSSDEEAFVTLKAQLNTKKLGGVLGPQLGSEGMKKLRAQVETLDTNRLRAIEGGEKIKIENIELDKSSLLIKRTPKDGAKAVASSGRITVVLDTAITPELRLEGIAREFVNRVQKLRKECDFYLTDRISVRYMTASTPLLLAIAEYQKYIEDETLAIEIKEVKDEGKMSQSQSAGFTASAQEIDGKAIIIAISRVQA